MDPNREKEIREELNASKREVPEQLSEYIRNLKVVDAVELPEFKESLGETMRKVWQVDVACRYAHVSSKTSVCHYLDGLNEWNIPKITQIYLGCLSKTLDTSRYSRRVRDFVTNICATSINMTIKKLTEKGL